MRRWLRARAPAAARGAPPRGRLPRLAGAACSRRRRARARARARRATDRSAANWPGWYSSPVSIFFHEQTYILYKRRHLMS